MKINLLTPVFLLVFSIGLLAQVPQAFKYQAVARDASGQLITNQGVSLRISILQGIAYDSIAYTEIHTDTTNAYGLVNIEIGKGDTITTSLNTIDWSNGPYFIKVEIDENMGVNYLHIGTFQLLSVPYALHAERFSGDMKNKPIHNVSEQSIGTASPNASAALEIESTNKGFLPPRMTQTQRQAINNPATGLIIFNTTTNKPNYFNGTEWINFDGTPAVLAIGDYIQGGVIFYLDGSGGGLVCAINNQDGGSGIQWYNGTHTTTGATSIAIGTGQANTTTIINNQGTGSYAAFICDTLTLNGYTDWFFPSRNELNEIYLNNGAINATATAYGGTSLGSNSYWSSSEVNNLTARSQFFATSQISSPLKESEGRVRAIRTFQPLSIHLT